MSKWNLRGIQVVHDVGFAEGLQRSCVSDSPHQRVLHENVLSEEVQPRIENNPKGEPDLHCDVSQ